MARPSLFILAEQYAHVKQPHHIPPAFHGGKTSDGSDGRNTRFPVSLQYPGERLVLDRLERLGVGFVSSPYLRRVFQFRSDPSGVDQPLNPQGDKFLGEETAKRLQG